MPRGRWFQSVVLKGYFVQSFQNVLPGRTVRSTWMPASRSCAATASALLRRQSSSIDTSSCTKSAIPASSISARAPAGSYGMRDTDGVVLGMHGAHMVVLGGDAASGIAELEDDRVVDGHRERASRTRGSA